MFINYSKQKTALVTDKNKKFSYILLKKKIIKLKKIFGKNNLIFIPGNNHLISIASYLACLESENTCLIYDKDYTKEILNNLISKYFPDILITNKKIKYNNYKFIYKILSFYFYEIKIKQNKISDKVKLIMPTSGTTANPKMTMLSLENIINNTQNIQKYLKLNKNDQTITNLPLNYVYGLSILNTHLYSGGSIILTDKKVNERGHIDILKKNKITNINGVPITYEILNAMKFNLKTIKKLRLITIAGGSLKKFVLENLHKNLFKNIKIFFMYGAAEATARMSYFKSKDPTDKPNTIGKAIIGGKFYLFNKNKEIKKPFKIGNLFYSGKNVFLGYCENRDQLSEKNFKKIKYLNTNDLAYFDKNKNFYITGRKDNFRKIYGHRINVKDIEMILNKNKLASVVRFKDNKLQIFTKSKYKKEISILLSKTTLINNNFYSIKNISQIKIKNNKQIK